MSKVIKQTIRVSFICSELRTQVLFLVTWHLQSME